MITYIIQAQYPRDGQWLDLRTIWPDATEKERLALLQEEKKRNAGMKWRLIRRTVTDETVAM